MRFTIPKLFTVIVAASSIVVASPAPLRGDIIKGPVIHRGSSKDIKHYEGGEHPPPHRGSDYYHQPPSGEYDEKKYSTVPIQPDFLIQIKEADPNHAYGKSDWGLVSRTNGKDNVQTLASFWIPPEYAGKKCKLVFYQAHDLSGSMSAQIFSVIGPIPEDATYNKRPSRNIHVATFQTDWTMAYGHAKFTYYGGEYFDCPGDQTLGYELVSVGDNDYIEWQQWYGFGIHVQY